MKAAVFREINAPLTIEDVDVDRPMAREVVVRMVAAGVCHSDQHVIDGSLRMVEPGTAVVLGHEPAGIVEAVGDQVSYLQPGDHVVACLSVFCGVCEQCLTGHPNRCRNLATRRGPSDPPRLSQQGTALNQFANLGSYAETILVHENSLVKIDDDIPLDRAALTGCGVLTGVGAALNTAKVHPGSTVAVFGCGGVGLSIVQGARIAGARRIIAVDNFDNKLEWAKQLGATHTVNAKAEEPVAAVRSLAGGEGVDYAFEAVGLPVLVRQAVESLAAGGTATVVGVLPTGSSLEFPSAALAGEKKLQTCGMGSNRFRVDIPRYLDLYRQGRLDLDSMVSRKMPLADINEAFRAMKAGEVARSVLTFD